MGRPLLPLREEEEEEEAEAEAEAEAVAVAVAVTVAVAAISQHSEAEAAVTPRAGAGLGLLRAVGCSWYFRRLGSGEGSAINPGEVDTCRALAPALRRRWRTRPYLGRSSTGGGNLPWATDPL